MDDLLELVPAGRFKHFRLYQQFHPAVLHHGQTGTDEHEVDVIHFDPCCCKVVRRYWSSGLSSQHFRSIFQESVT